MGRTALHFAVMNDNEDIAKLLLCFKADPSIEDIRGESPYSMHERMGFKCNHNIGLHMKLASSVLFRQKHTNDFVQRAKLAALARKDDQTGRSTNRSNNR